MLILEVGRVMSHFPSDTGLLSQAACAATNPFFTQKKVVSKEEENAPSKFLSKFPLMI